MNVDIFLYDHSAYALVDIILCDPTALCVGVPTSLPRDDKPAPGYDRHRYLPRGKPFRERHVPEPVVANSLMDNLVNEYGVIHGREVYFAMEREMKGPFRPGNKYDVAARTVERWIANEQPAPKVTVEPAPAARKN